MRCKNCGYEAGRRGNKHVRNRSYSCTRRMLQKTTRRNWLGRTVTHEEYVIVESLIPTSLVSDWAPTDELRFESSTYHNVNNRNEHYASPSEGPSYSSPGYTSDSQSYSSDSSSYGSGNSSYGSDSNSSSSSSE